jgi:glycosyltransferase involved in cell wall biosynthesis
MKKVVIVKRYDREFRLPLYDLLGSKLNEKGAELEIIYGQPDRWEAKNIKDLIRPHRWGKQVQNRYIGKGKRAICWQPALRRTRNADLVIVQQGNRELLNYGLLLRRMFRKKPAFAFWGHGMNFQASNEKGLKERWKSFYSNFADYWFAYNDFSKEIMTRRGFDPGKITALQNTIDTRGEAALYDSIPEQEVEKLRSAMNIGKESVVGIYCGSIYPEKRIDFLIQALTGVRSEIPDFHFVIVGDGILRQKLLEMIAGHESWIHYVGPKFGQEKLPYFKMASFQLIPGLVGLNIIDSFITLTPLITTENRLHSPEISYLINYENAIMTPNTLEDYSAAVIKAAKDTRLQEKMNQGCMQARKIYTIENMAENFYLGVQKILGLN